MDNNKRQSSSRPLPQRRTQQRVQSQNQQHQQAQQHVQAQQQPGQPQSPSAPCYMQCGAPSCSQRESVGQQSTNPCAELAKFPPAKATRKCDPPKEAKGVSDIQGCGFDLQLPPERKKQEPSLKEQRLAMARKQEKDEKFQRQKRVKECREYCQSMALQQCEELDQASKRLTRYRTRLRFPNLSHLWFLLAGMPLFMAGGMNVTWTFDYRSAATADSIKYAFFIGGIIGAIIGAILVRFLIKKIVLIVAAVLFLIQGALFLATDEFMVARYFSGIGFGLFFVAIITMLGEVTGRYIRGLVGTLLDTIPFTLGIFLQIIFSLAFPRDQNVFINSETAHGISIVLLALISGLCAIMIHESPMYYVYKKNKNLAAEADTALFNYKYPYTGHAQGDFDEFKCYLLTNKGLKCLGLLPWGILTFIKLCIIRAFLTVAYNYAMVMAIHEMVPVKLIPCGGTWECAQIEFDYRIAEALMILPRLLGAVVTAIFIDFLIGRRLFLVIGLVFMIICLILMRALFDNTLNLQIMANMTGALTILFIFQAFSGFAYPPTTVYLTEAFPLVVKPCCIAIVFIIEMVLHIVFISYNGNPSSFFTLAIIFLSIAAILSLTLPETKTLTLRQALFKFQKLLGCMKN